MMHALENYKDFSLSAQEHSQGPGAKAKTKDLPVEIKAKDIKNVLEDPWGRGHVLEDSTACLLFSWYHCAMTDDTWFITESNCVDVCQIWKRDSLDCSQVLQGHSGSVLCLQYDHNVIVSGSSDATVRSVV